MLLKNIFKKLFLEFRDVTVSKFLQQKKTQTFFLGLKLRIQYWKLDGKRFTGRFWFDFLVESFWFTLAFSSPAILNAATTTAKD